MRSRFAVVIALLGGTAFYSFLLYELAQLSVLGMAFTHYLDALITFLLVPSIIFAVALFYYQLYDRFVLLRLSGIKYITGFLVSFFVLYGWDVLSSGIHFHIVTTLIGSLLLMCLFIDDPNSVRSLKRTRDKLEENEKERDV